MASKSSSSNSSSVRSSSSNIINNNNISSSRGSLSPRMIVDPHCIPVPLAAHPADHEGNPMIVRPTPRRATESNPASSSSSSSAAGSDLNARREINKSLTGIANNNINISNNNHHKTSAQETTNKLKSLSPQMTNRSSASSSSASSRVLESEKYVGRSPVSKMGSSPDSHLLPERDTGASSSFSNKPWSSKSQGEAYFQKINAEGFVTNVMIDKLPDESSSSSSVTRVVQDSGYQILSSKDEEVERDNRGAAAAAAAAGHDHHGNKKIKSAASSSSSSNSKYKLNNQRYKPRRKAAPVSGQYKNPGKQHDHVKRNNISVAADKLGDEADRSKDNNINHLLDVKAAIERLNLHTPLDEQCSHSSSSYSSTSVGSESEPQANNSPKAPRGKGSKNLSQETLNTTVTSADEFVWIDSHNRLVELQQLPWTTTDIGSVIKRCLEYESSESTDRIGPDILPRLSYYLQRVLVRLAREAQRLSKNIGKCGKKEICTALKIVLSPTLATTAVRACLRAAAMFAISGDATRQSKSNRASLTLPVGRMHQWMCLVKVGKFIHEYAAIYLTAGMESILEEVVGHCLAVAGRDSTLTASLLEQVVSTNGEIWGIFQPYAHLSSSRVASGTLTLSPAIETLTSAAKSESGSGRSRQSSIGAERNVRQILLTTCVGSCDELEEMVLISGSIFQKVWQSVTTSSSSGHSYRPVSSTGGLIGLRGNLGWCADAIRGLYHFMRCSQLEYVGQDGRSPIQVIIIILFQHA